MLDVKDLVRDAKKFANDAVQSAIPYVVAGADAVANAAENLKNKGAVQVTNSTAIELVKGEEINLTKATGGKTKFLVRLSWDEGTDLDVSAIPLNTEGKLVTPIVYYRNLTAPGLVHSGDLRDGGVEEITITTPELTQPRVLATITSHSQNNDGSRGTPIKFGAAARPKAELIDPTTGEVLVVVNLKSDAGLSTAVEFVEIYKNGNGDWLFKALVNPIGTDAFGLADVVAKYQG